MLKLLRLLRIKRIFNVLDPRIMNKIVELLFSNHTRSKKVIFSIVMKNVYLVFRLILLTIIITYFAGCVFYMWSKYSASIWL